MPDGPHLFSRLDLINKTGIPDDVVNYWTREGVLRARQGGEGRGNPRKFDYPEIMLAAILDQLRGFGLNVAALKGLAERFHQALDYFRALNLNRSNYDELHRLLDMKTYDDCGDPLGGFTQFPDQYPEYEWKEVRDNPGVYNANVPFDELIKKPDLWKSKSATQEQVDAAITSIQIIDPDEYDAHYWYWITLVDIHRKSFSGQPDHFERDTAGHWHMTRGDPKGRAWISVNTSALNFGLWAGDRGLRE